VEDHLVIGKRTKAYMYQSHLFIYYLIAISSVMLTIS
jgi:hypothetical protein